MNIREGLAAIITTLLLCYPTGHSACIVDQWKYLKNSQKYVYTESELLSCSAASFVCERLGGQLLIIEDETTQDDIFHELWNHRCQNLHWIGLSNIETGEYAWVDGTPMTQNSFQFWMSGHKEKKGRFCAAIMSCEDDAWRAENPNNKRLSICEAKKPCASRPAMTVNNGEVLENDEITIRNKHEVVIKCFLRGYASNVIWTSLFCLGSRLKAISTDRISETKILYIDDRMPTRNCVCKANSLDRTSEKSQLEIISETNPRYAAEIDNTNMTFTLQVGDEFKYSIQFYANPKPIETFVLKNGNGGYTEDKDFGITTKPSDKPIHWTLTVSRPDVRHEQSGTYTLVIDNGVPRRLEFVFRIAFHSHKGSCTKNDWTYLEHSKKYIQVSVMNETCKSARDRCEEIGGQLLVIRDRKTHEIVQRLVRGSKCSRLYWIGLNNMENEKYKWVDGTLLGKDSFSQWNPDEPSKSGSRCAAIKSCSDGRWVTGEHTNKNMFVCEARAPCTSRPVLRFNDGERMESGEILITNEQNTKIECNLRGFKADVSKVKLWCPGNVEQIATDDKYDVIQSVHVNISMHGKKCVCLSELKDGFSMKSEVEINFHTCPRFTKQINAKKKTFTVLPGHQFVYSFDFYANPQPSDYIFVKHGNNGSHEIGYFDVINESLENPMFKSIRINRTNYTRMYRGTYTFIIDNGIHKRLEFVFGLEEPSSDSNDDICWWGFTIPKYMRMRMVIVSIAVAVPLLMVVLLTCICRDKKGKAKEEAITSEDVEVEETGKETTKSWFFI